METILETLKQKSDDPDFVLADFLVHHGNELLFDLDRALDFIYCDADESYKARILVDLYKVKHLLETNRNKSGIKDNPYDRYLTSLSVKEPLSEKDFSLLYDCVCGIDLRHGPQLYDPNAIKAMNILKEIKEPESRILRFLLSIKRNGSELDVRKLFDLSSFGGTKRSDIVASYSKAKSYLGRNSYIVLDALCFLCTKEKNDYTLENKVVYQNFVAGIKNSFSIGEPLLVVEPSVPFIRKWLHNNPADNRKVIFSLSDDNVRALFGVMFADSGVVFAETSRLDRLFINSKNLPTNIMFFGNHFADPERKKNALSSLAAISAGIRRFCAFDNDDSFENKLSVYNGLYSNSFVDRVWLFPTGIENETVPARKMMVSAVLGYTSNNDHKTTIYKYSLAKNHSDRLSSHFLSIKERSDILSGHSASLRGLFRKEMFAVEAKSDTKRKKAMEFFFSKEITFFYTVSVKNNEYRVRAYIKDRYSNKVIEESKVSVRLHSEEEVDDWLADVYPYSVHRSSNSDDVDIQRLISINLENEFSNCDITLKSLIYFSSEKINKLPAKAVEIIKRFSDSEISGFYTSDISTEMLGDQIDRMGLPLQASIHALTSLFGVAVSENRTDRNPAKELLTLYENENNTALSEVRSAMGKKFLFKDEMKKFLSIQHKQNRAISLASEIELATGLEPNIICALVWADYKTYEYAEYRFSALIVRKQLNNYGTVFLNFNSRSSYRIVPLPGALSDVIDKERARQLAELAKGDEYYLASCSIIQGSDSIINGQTAVLAPASLYKANRKAIKKMRIDEDLVSVPDDSGGSIETNLAYYKGNIFRSNFRHWALGRTGILTKEEYAYLSGNKGPNTFSSNYCDYGNLISLTKLYLKIERVWKEMNNE